MRHDVLERFTEPSHGYYRGNKYPRNNKKLTKTDEDGHPVNDVSKAHVLSGEHEGRWPGEDYRFIRRLLAGNVGRPWDEVYSEICKEADSRNFVAQRLREAVSSIVESNCYMDEDGTIRDDHDYKVDGGYRDQLYVHPKTGILERAECKGRTNRYRNDKPPTTVYELDGQYYHEHEGIWYRVEMENVADSRLKYGMWYYGAQYYLGAPIDVFGANSEQGKKEYLQKNPHSWWCWTSALRKKYGLSPDGKLWYAKTKQSANKNEIKAVKKKHKID